jgi:hypothetical protein
MVRMKTALFVIALMIPPLGKPFYGQDRTGKKNLGLQLEIQTDKSRYAAGERIRFKALLSNEGSSNIYVAKSLSEAGAGVAGFSISVKQLTGKPNRLGCGSIRSTDGADDRRTSEQILREDYMSLPPKGIVGYEDEYHGCVVSNSGTYEIKATYCACGFNVDRLGREKPAQVAVGAITSRPLRFRVFDGHTGTPKE